ncbi:organic cation/carnitine transporter 3-like [Punica granatum]|uniref:Major facilitator superfamily (MFS) profile domain-containing protein n=2 Tax=Punica granatum TaxID=22663 RepID=A0A218VT74_PUNGR|nr:organic cation/carnitine transporter 3-like [Punica granatum]OWM63523.1 hypothetical protein CDL15_Pgr019472 [Punica granatum]PKI62832.1 hypothetical protein CRG98_016783 [Punica granatum]
MADETLFLSNHQPSTPDKKPLLTMDSMIEQCIGKFGWAQLDQAVLVSLSWLFDAQQTFISVFTDSDPAWHCTDPIKCVSGTSDLCGLPDGSWAWDEVAGHSSVVSEWGLQCATPIVRGLPASSFFVGCLIGGLILARLADSSLGRRNLLLLSCLSMGVSSLVTAFSNSIWVYAALRFVCGFWRAAIGTCALVLATELVGKRWRGPVGMLGLLGSTVGFLSLPAIAYVNRGRSWRRLYLWTSIPALLYCSLVYFLVRESPRWLLVRGRKEEAIQTLKSIAPPEQRPRLTSSFFSTVASLDDYDPLTEAVDHFSAVKLLFMRRWALLRLSIVSVVGFGIGMVYYGMPLGLANLSFNLYLGVAFNAFSEVPSTLAAMLLITKLNRRHILLVLTAVSTVFSLACTLKGEPWERFQMGFELVSFGTGCSALCVLLIYTLELFPTCVRNSAVSLVRQALVLGGTFSPVLVAAGRATGGTLSYGVFGAVIGCCGLFTACLPNTQGGTLCDTMEEEELKMRERSSGQISAPLTLA